MDTGEGMVDSVPGKALGNVQNDIYKKKYEILMSRCREMEQDNHKIAYRIFKIDKLCKEARHDKKILKRRLDLHRDEWRSAYAERNSANSLETLVPPSSNTSVSPAAPQQKSIKLKINLAKQQASTSKATPSRQATPSTSRAAAKPQPQAKIHGGKPKAVMPIKPVNRPSANTPANKMVHGGKPLSLIRPPMAMQPQTPKAQNRRASTDKGGKKATKESPKPRKPKVEKDPNAPKKPANPFLQFCKEQRLITTELMRGASDINKQELNKVLCNRWKTLAQEDKKVYYDKYELEKQQYSLELEIYDRQKGGLMGSIPSELFDLP